MFIQLGPENCIRCMLQMIHKRCEPHKYIHVAGGYRHSYEFLKSIMGDLLAALAKDLYERELQLQAIEEAREGAGTPRKLIMQYVTWRLVFSSISSGVLSIFTKSLSSNVITSISYTISSLNSIENEYGKKQSVK